MIDGDVVALLKVYAEELFGSVEDAFFQHACQLEVGLDGFFIEVVTGASKLLGVKRPVPGLKLEGSCRILLVDQGLEVCRLFGDESSSFLDEFAEEAERGLLGLGHLVVELPRGVALEAEQSGALGTKLGEAGNGLGGVVGVAGLGSRPCEVEERFASIAIGERVEEVLLGGVLDRQRPAFQVTQLREFGGGCDLGFAEASERGDLRRDEERIFGCSEHLGKEGGGEGRGLFVELLEAGLVSFVEVGAGVDEAIVVGFEQADRFGIEV